MQTFEVFNSLSRHIASLVPWDKE